MVNLEVAGVDHGADGRFNGQAHSVGNAVAHAEELHPEGSDLDRYSGLRDVELGAAGGPVVVQLDGYEAVGQPGGVYGNI